MALPLNKGQVIAPVCVIDDDEAIREALKLLLWSNGLQSATFPSAEAFLSAAGDREFCCILLDIRMPGMDGLDLFNLLVERRQAAPVVFITGHGDIPMAVSAIQRGAFDFLTKPFRDGELVEKISRAVAHYQSNRESLREIESICHRAMDCTPRELVVMAGLAQGMSNKEIAAQLGISPRTVEIHRAKVMGKMQADSLPDLVRMHAFLEPS